MAIVPQWLIEKKRDGGTFTTEEIQAWIAGVTDGSLPDYQVAAWLMAVYLRGMSVDETSALTDAMLHSGDLITFEPTLPTADKHSTGGIGDKISIPLAPVAAAMGVAVPMISGRGLGITGGTLDKLESIPGMNVRLDVETFKQMVRTLGCCMIGQTERLAPADKRLYALRDVTGTVPSIPLITASILSKKLAEGASALVFDVKFGSGAFMGSYAQAQLLAESLLRSARQLGRKCTALLTDMDQPLGRTIGNAVEVAESLEILQGQGPADVRLLVLEEAAHMALLAGVCQTLDQARASAAQVIASGAAMEKFEQMVAAQGGSLRQGLPQAKCTRAVYADHRGFVAHVNARKIGEVALQLGAGRKSVQDQIDMGAGISALCQCGERIERGQALCILHASSEALIEEQYQNVVNAITLSDSAPAPHQLIHSVL